MKSQKSQFADRAHAHARTHSCAHADNLDNLACEMPNVARDYTIKSGKNRPSND